MAGRQFDEEVLETAIDRRPALSALADEPHHRRELQAKLDISKTTCHRIVRSFDEKGLLRRTDRGYELTELGEFLERQVDRFHSRVRAAYRLEPLVTAFESTDVDFDVDAFADASITEPRPDDPTPPIKQAWERFQESAMDTVRIVDGTQFAPPLYERGVLEAALETAVAGEVIVPKSYADHLVTEYPDLHRAFADASAQLGYRIYDDVPFGMSIHDEYVELRAYDDDTGSLVLLVHGESPEALAWAEDVYDHYREKAALPSEFEELPDLVPEPEGEC